MPELFAQGDILLERVSDRCPSGRSIAPALDGATVVAEGETTGHRHVFWDNVSMFRDDALARSIPSSLYVGHVNVPEGGATLRHEEHAPISLPPGTYQLRRQREVQPRDVAVVVD